MVSDQVLKQPISSTVHMMHYKKKILHITQAHGGVKTYIENIIRHADPNAFDFVIISPPHPEFEEFCTRYNVRYLYVNLKRNVNPFNDLSVLIKIISIIKKEKPDVVHAHSAKGGFLGRLACKFASKTVIYTPNGFSYLPFTGIARVVFYILEYIARKWTTALLAVSYSEANRAYFELGFPKKDVDVVLNSIRINEGNIRQNYTSNFRIGMIGRLTYQKNPMLFLEIANKLMKKYPFLQFSILGAGLHDHLDKEINDFLTVNQLVNKIRILKWGNSNTSIDFINNTDIFVMTSAFEGLPFSLLEAMSKSIPCVVSKADGNSDVIQNSENGFACLSVDDFCERIEALINHEDLRKKMGQAAFSYVKKYHEIRCNISQIEKVYNKLAVLQER